MASAAAVLVLVGGAALLLRVTGSDSPVATTPPTDLVNEWSRVPHDEPVFSGAGGASMNSVTVGGPGLVAVGDRGVWTSIDGIAWSRVFDGGSMSSVTVGGPGLVAVGDGGVWTSIDGIAWSRVFGGASMSSVTVGGPGLVAVGDGGVWTSVDGIAWSQVPHDAAVFGGEGSLEMVSVTAGGPGLVAVGQVEGFAVVWTSVDGITWSRVPHDEAVFGAAGTQRMNSVTAGGPGLVAVGMSDGDPQFGTGNKVDDAAVWTSPDGFRWSRVPHSDAVFDAPVAFGVGGSAEMTSVTAGGPGLVAVGEANGFAAVWTSPDGITWSPVFRSERVLQLGNEWALATTRMSSVTAGGPGVVAVGSIGSLLARDIVITATGHSSEWDVTAAVWVAATDD